MNKTGKNKTTVKNRLPLNEGSRKFEEQINQYYLLQEFIDNIPDYIYIKDKKNRFIMINRAMADFLGSKPENIIGKTDFDFFPDDRSKEYSSDEKQAMKEHRPIIDKVDKLTYKGKEHWISASKIPWYDREGNVLGTMGISRDITTRKRSTDSRLKESEEFSQSILENSPSPIYVMNIDKSMRYVNPAFEKLTGFTAKEIIGTKPPRPYWIKGMENIYTPNLEIALSKGVNNLELPFANKKGKKFWVEVSLKPLRGDDGKIKYMLGIFTDITERKNTYHELEKTLDNIINTLSSIVETRDPYTSGHQKRVTLLSVEIAKELKLDDEKIKFIKIAAQLHDIGKINIPPSILSKPASLSDVEFNIIKSHPQTGFNIIKNINFRFPVENVILQHHEREDGSGYPAGLKGREISLEAKIIGVADVVEAMCSHRPYRPSLGIKAALNEIKTNKGKLYDPDVVDACLKVFKSGKFSFPEVNLRDFL
jgi:PAS domain S-box-containing protein/putative nucleotidyltransferase with HDIG domain